MYIKRNERLFIAFLSLLLSFFFLNLFLGLDFLTYTNSSSDFLFIKDAD